jgi:hypothetical protein
MSEDLLREAARALRESTSPAGQGATFTRARVMASLHQKRRQRTTRRALLWPLAAILIGSTAWAGYSGKLPEVVRVMARAAGIRLGNSEDAMALVAPPASSAGAQSTAAEAAARLRPVRAQSESAAEPKASVSPPPEESVSRGAVPRPRLAPETATAKSGDPARAAASSLPEPASPPADEPQTLYKTAHRAHFELQDWSAALAAWDAYLLRSPRGRFAPEAQYNRALCLVRLGRTGEAQAALAPFAQGSYGEYRQREARALLEALGGQP